MAPTMAESEALCEKIRAFFFSEERRDFIVELSERPMTEWKIIPTPTEDEMVRWRFRLECNAGFGRDDEGTYFFYYLDRNLFMLIDVARDEIVAYEDVQFEEHDLRLVAKEFAMLAEMFRQGS